MHGQYRVILFAILLFALVAAVVRSTLTGAQERPASQPAARVTAPRQLVGASSCAASVCHGGSEIGKPLSEATTWRALDPHARAYDTLLTPASLAMTKRLLGDKTYAHETPLCLKCHVHPEYDHARPNFRKADGVGCESCHGSAQDWLTPHYRGDWKQADKKAFGLADTKSLPIRAAICARCHVGTPAANVDHDLIAAGHPALRFEFATYLANLPPHWDVAKDKSRHRDGNGVVHFEASAWTIGQIVSTRHALELLAHRADPASAKPWPEFAELDCFACHHHLQSPTWRQKKAHVGARRPGGVAWSSWYFTSGPKFDDVRPSAKTRAGLAKKARIAAERLRVASHQSGQVHRDLSGLELSAATTEPPTWEHAVQNYLALLASRQFKRDNNRVDEKHERLIARRRQEITLEPGFLSPRRFVPKLLENPGLPSPD